VAALVVLWSGATWGVDASAAPPGTPASNPTQRPVVVSVPDDGFDWADAGVGGAATLAVCLLAVGVLMAVRSRPDTTRRNALSSAQREEP
jgi:hypothetical protein